MIGYFDRTEIQGAALDRNFTHREIPTTPGQNLNASQNELIYRTNGVSNGSPGHISRDSVTSRDRQNGTSPPKASTDIQSSVTSFDHLDLQHHIAACSASLHPGPSRLELSSDKDWRRFQFLIECTIPSIEVCSAPEHEFWSRIALQAGEHRRCVREALLAIQAYHESILETKSSLEHLERANSQYVKALRSTVKEQSPLQTSDFGEMLILSVIFRAIEMLRNNYTHAFIHLKASRSMMDEKEASHIHSTSIDDIFTPMISRLEYKSMPLSDLGANAYDSEVDHTDIEPARRKGHALMSWACHVLSLQGPATTKESFESFRALFINLGLRWTEHIDEVIKNQWSAGVQRSYSIYAKLNFFLSKVAFNVMTFSDEQIYDKQTKDFETMIGLCKEYASLKDRLLQDSGFGACQARPVRLAIGVELIATAFLVGEKCREPTIRHSALEFLKSTPRRESSWYSSHAASILDFVRYTEEKGLRVTTSTDIPISQRLSLKRIEYFYSGSGPAQYPAKLVVDFQPPAWARIEYVIGGQAGQVQERWIDLASSEDNDRQWASATPPVCARFAYEVQEPFMPSTAAMIILAYRQGLRRRLDLSPEGEFECNRSIGVDGQSCSLEVAEAENASKPCSIRSLHLAKLAM